MNKQAFSYTPPPFVDIYAGIDHEPAAAGTWFAALNPAGLGIAEQATRLASLDSESANPGFDHLSPAGQAKYDSALTTCLPTHTPDVYIPASSSQLNDQLLQLMSEVEKNALVADAKAVYPSCMKSAGFNVTNPDELIELMQRVIAAVPHEAVGKPDRTQWTAAMDRDRAAGAADARCRQKAYDQAMMLLPARLDAFAEDHATELAGVQQDWNALVDQATAFPEAKQLGIA
jgi:hypothetical protein